MYSNPIGLLDGTFKEHGTKETVIVNILTYVESCHVMQLAVPPLIFVQDAFGFVLVYTKTHSPPYSLGIKRCKGIRV